MLRRIAAIALLAAVLIAALAYSQRRHVPPKVSGFVEADEIRVGSRVGGRVARVAAEEGARVKEGDALVEFEAFDLRDELARARAELAAREAELARLVAGFRAEEIAQARARRDALAAELAKLVAGPRPQEIRAAREDLALAQAQLELARIESDRQTRLRAEEATSQEALDRAAGELRVREAAAASIRERLALLEEGTRSEDIDRARAGLAETEQALALAEAGYRAEEVAAASASADAARAAVAAVESRVAELAVVAPCDGVVEAVEIRPGDLVAPGAPALSIVATGRLWVRAYVPENRLDLSEGTRLRVTTDSFPGEDFAGVVTFVARQAEFTPRNVQTPEERSKQVFRVKVTLTEGLDRLRPGMAADVWLDSASRP